MKTHLTSAAIVLFALAAAALPLVAGLLELAQ